MRNCWIIGSVETVTDRLVELYNKTGGFGTLLWSPTDYGEHPERMRHTLELLVNEVLPRVNNKVKPLPAATDSTQARERVLNVRLTSNLRSKPADINGTRWHPMDETPV